MSDHIDNRIEFDAQTAASGAVMDWLDADEYRAFIGCTPAMVAQTAVAAYRRSREQACAITTVEQLDALPEGSVIRRGGFCPRTLEREGRFWHSPGDEMGETAGADMLPALLLWHPEWATS